MSLRVTLVAASLVGAGVVQGVAASPAQATAVWPAHGQAAYVLGSAAMHASRHQKPVPIASVAKVMTAYLVLRRHPIAGSQRGFTMTVTTRDVADLHRRVARGESTVPVRRGERLTERQALYALLLPSANNVAIMLARRVSGSVHRFVALMNSTARTLHLRHTTYTDPSGFEASTRSTAADQVTVAQAAMRLPFLRYAVGRRHVRIPVAGTIRNTDTLLGHDGFVGIKTGSMSASGGCFVFRSHRVVHGKSVDITGVVLGQRGYDLIHAGLRGAQRLVDRVAPRAG